MFDPFSATFEEANKLSNTEDLRINPIFQWNAAQEINQLKSEVEKGDGFTVLECIRKCVTFELIAPQWLAYAFNSRYDAVLNFRAKSWDDPKSFGKPYKKGTNINARRKERITKYAIYYEAKRLLRENPETPMDEYFFEKIGKKFNIGKTLASEYYYKAKSSLPR